MAIVVVVVVVVAAAAADANPPIVGEATDLRRKDFEASPSVPKFSVETYFHSPPKLGSQKT